MTEPFPDLPEEDDSCPSLGRRSTPRRNGTSQSAEASTPTTSRIRSASLKFLQSNPPYGMWQATGEIASRIPTLNEIRGGSFSHNGWTEEGQLERRGNTPHEIQRRRRSRVNTYAMRTATAAAGNRISVPFPMPPLDSSDTQVPPEAPERTVHEDTRTAGPVQSHPADRSPLEDDTDKTGQVTKDKSKAPVPDSSLSAVDSGAPAPIRPDETGVYPNGYTFPPKHTWKQSIVIGLTALGRFTLTPFGFLTVLYGLNVVAWGAMIFFVLLKAAPAMCHPSCDAIDSPRKIWIEIDSQILNALFCVTGFGLIPWRFRDFYHLIRWRIFGSHDALRKLAGVHRAWFRLAGSENLPDDIGPPPVYTAKRPRTVADPPPYTDEEIEELRQNPALPLPPSSIPPAPLTGVRAPPTATWLLDLVVWMYILNTAFQAVLCGFMWGMNRYNRPGWATGVFIALGCAVAIVAGLVSFKEGNKIKGIEGVPVDEEPHPDDIEKLATRSLDSGEEPELDAEELLARRRKTRQNSLWYRRH